MASPYTAYEFIGLGQRTLEQRVGNMEGVMLYGAAAPEFFPDAETRSMSVFAFDELGNPGLIPTSTFNTPAIAAAASAASALQYSIAAQNAANSVNRPSPYLVRVQRDTAMPGSGVPNAAQTEIPMTSAVFDTFGATLNSGRVIIPRTGYYTGGVHGSFDGLGSVTRIRAELVNSKQAEMLIGAELSASGFSAPGRSGLFYLNKGDQIFMRMFQSSGSAINIRVAEADLRPSFWLTEIDPKAPEIVSPLSDIPVVLAGDSNAAASEIGPQFSLGNYLTSNLTNLGHAGWTTQQILTAISEITDQAGSNKVFILLAGSNDLGYTLSPNISAIVDRVEAIANACIPLFAKVLILPPPPSSLYYAYTNYGNYNNDRATYIAALVARFAGSSAKVVRTDLDTQIGLVGTEGNPIFSIDRLHYAPPAMKKLAAYCFDAINA